MRILLRLTVLLFAFTCSAASYAGGQTTKPIRILFIGNSYTYFNDMPQLLRQIASAGDSHPLVEIEAVTAGGVSLKWHWEQGAAQAALFRKKWDYVVLQDFSTLPLTDPATVQTYIRLFDERIKSVGARTVLYLTWSRATAPQTQAALDRTYFDIGNELGARVAPVGPAWALARKIEPQLQLYESDNSHPTLAGSYLAAYVFHITLFGKAPTSARAPQGLTQIEHRALLRAALAATGRGSRVSSYKMPAESVAVEQQ